MPYPARTKVSPLHRGWQRNGQREQQCKSRFPVHTAVHQGDLAKLQGPVKDASVNGEGTLNDLVLTCTITRSGCTRPSTEHVKHVIARNIQKCQHPPLKTIQRINVDCAEDFKIRLSKLPPKYLCKAQFMRFSFKKDRRAN